MHVLNADCSAIHSRHPLRDAAQDFIGNALAQASQFDGIDTLALVGADQDHFVSYSNARNMADVHHREVHRNTAYDRRVLAADDHAGAIGEQAWIAVSITNREHGDAGTFARDVAAHVADRFSGWNILYSENTRFPREYWNERERRLTDNFAAAQNRKRIPIEKNARTHHGLPGFGTSAHGGRIAHVYKRRV